MISFTSAEIASVINGRLSGPQDIRVDHIITDSRKYSGNRGTLFCAIRGERNDGHSYIPELYTKGIRCFITEHAPEGDGYADACFVIVGDSLEALQLLAAHLRLAFPGEVVAITGSNGKTIIKEWIYQALNREVAVIRSPMSYNSQVGVPLSIFLLDDRYSLAVIEAGISKPGEMEKLERMIQPDTGIFSNIGQAHQENFSSQEEKVAEKIKLFGNCTRLICCHDHSQVYQSAAELPRSVKVISWGFDEGGDYKVKPEIEAGRTRIAISGRCTCDFTIGFTDHASVENAVHVFVFLHDSGYSIPFITAAMEKLEPVAMRLEVVKGMNHCTLINDTYNSDLVSLSNALDFLNRQEQHEKKTLILSDILQSGKSAGELYREVAALLADKNIDRLIGVGPEISAHSYLFNQNSVFFAGTEDFLRAAARPVFRNEAILLKGSRRFGFERITGMLQEKAHRTVLEINLNALMENYRYYKSLLGRQTRIMAMVKAFSYGSGGYEVASILQYNHVDYLAVAFADEGVTLRKNGIHVPVMVMNPEINDFFLLTEYNLEPEIYNFRILDEFKKYLVRNGIKRYPVHIKIDTGMHRLGFEEKDIHALTGALKDEMVSLVSVFSHLAAADDPAGDEFTHIQINRFRSISERIREGTGQNFLRHILNTAGVERFPDAAFDMVRLGIGLYGVSSFHSKMVQEVSTFKTSIAQIREVPAGDSVGYGMMGKSDEKRRIATLPVGYADGIFRTLGNGKGKFMVNGRLVPVAGNICMDMTMVDVTGITAEENDEVIIFGRENPVQDIAAAAGTIPYEILTRIPERVRRIWYQE